VIPNELVGTAKVPGGGELRCWRHDGDFSIRIDGIELMSSRVHGSEEAMAELAIERLGVRSNPRVLVGGLGMGFTLARALQLAGPESIVDVVEVLHMGDVNSRISEVNGLYDMMLLDVDNGPDGLVRGDNDRIYSRRGLDRAWDALRPRSVLAVWSSRSDDRFAERLERGGFQVQEHRVRARRTKGPVRTIWIAWRR
jgi:hypothetical protein